MDGRARVGAFGCVLLVAVTVAAFGASGSALKLKPYTLAKGVTLSIPSEWKVLDPSGHELFWAADGKHTPGLAMLTVYRVSWSHQPKGTLEGLAGQTILDLRKKLTDKHFVLVGKKIVRLPAGRAVRIVYRVDSSRGRDDWQVYELLHGPDWWLFEYAAGPVTLARQHTSEFTRSMHSLHFAP